MPTDADLDAFHDQLHRVHGRTRNFLASLAALDKEAKIEPTDDEVRPDTRDLYKAVEAEQLRAVRRG